MSHSSDALTPPARRLKAIGQLGNLERIVPAKDWRTSWHGGGARRVVREEHRI
jgi:hypothetical protein